MLVVLVPSADWRTTTRADELADCVRAIVDDRSFTEEPDASLRAIEEFASGATACTGEFLSPDTSDMRPSAPLSPRPIEDVIPLLFCIAIEEAIPALREG